MGQELELKQHSLSLLEERARGSEAHQLAEAAAATQAELKQAQQAAQAARERKQELVAAAKVRWGSEGGGLGFGWRVAQAGDSLLRLG